MDRKVKSFRLRVDLLTRLRNYADERGSTEVGVMESALESFFNDSRGGVPDLAPDESSPPVNVTQQSRPVPDLMAQRQARLNKEMGWSA